MRTQHRRARLIYNSTAGRASRIRPDDLLAALSDAGFSTVYDPTSSEAEIDAALQGEGDLVVAAGGDGTVRAVATRLVGRGVPLVIVPLGTANNVAAAVGVDGVPPLELLKGLHEPEFRKLDVGVVRGPWGADYFLESAGAGLYADLLRAYSPEQGRSLLRAAKSAVQVLPGYQAGDWRLTLDGKGVSGRYLLIEAMNTPCLGMRNCLAPDADPTDGKLDIVLVAEDDRVGLLAFFTQTVAGNVASLPNVAVHQVRELRFEWAGTPIHSDEVLRTEVDSDGPGTLEIDALAGALELWIPAAVAARPASPNLSAV